MHALDVSPAQGKFLHLLAQLMGARCALEIGTLMGAGLKSDGRTLNQGTASTTGLNAFSPVPADVSNTPAQPTVRGVGVQPRVPEQRYRDRQGRNRQRDRQIT